MEGDRPIWERMIQDCLSEEVILSWPREKLRDFQHRQQQMQKSCCSLGIIIREKCTGKKVWDDVEEANSSQTM